MLRVRVCQLPIGAHPAIITHQPQIEDAESLTTLGRKYQTLKVLGGNSSITRFSTKREMMMTGKCLVMTDPESVSPG